MIFLLLAAACSRSVPPAVFRDTGIPIYSNAVIAPDRLTGAWRQVAEFAGAAAPPCAARGATLSPAAPGRLRLDADLCLDGRPARFHGPAEVTGPGRLRPVGADPAGLGAEWWVLWADADGRTLVIGTPSGAFGMILDRGTLSPDRAAAAREILAWNGYDLGRLRPVGRR
jgi:apolipoprotein D and lipocalin family protein